MDFSLSPAQQALRQEIIQFAKAELNEGVGQRDESGCFPRDRWLKCGEMRLQGLAVPSEYGGRGLDPLSTAIALEALGYACHDGGLGFSVCAHLLASAVPIWKFGSEAQKSRYLPGLSNGTVIGANAMSEPDSGSDGFSLKTLAMRDGDGFRLRGDKMFVTNGPVADVVVIFARTQAEKTGHDNITAFLLDSDAPGLQVGPPLKKMGLHTSLLGSLRLDDVPVSDDAILGGMGGGAGVFNLAMDWERTCLFAAHVGTMERLLEQVVARARGRKQFGQAIGKFQAVAHPIADMKVHLEAARLLVYRAASNLGRSKSVSLDAAMAKLFVSESLVKAAIDTMQIHGGYGYLQEYGIERAARDALGSTIYSGTSEMQRMIIARWLGL